MTVNTLPANLPNTPDAKLPANYEAAQHALAECTRVDDAWTWQNKAAALAAYARMARDTALRDMALRIQARAIRRAGELLRMIPSAQGERTDKLRDGADPKLTRERAATDAGLSGRQRKTALRVASIPPEDFTGAVESPQPPTVTALAARGIAHKPLAPEPDIAPADHATAARAQSLLRNLAAFCATHDAAAVARASSLDADMMRGTVETIDRWLDRFVTRLAPPDDGEAF